jgi:hypothetical protein
MRMHSLARSATAFCLLVLCLLVPVASAHAVTGGTYTISTGETVRVEAGDSLVPDDARNQHWAEFLGSLLHGPELSSVTLTVTSWTEMQSICGRGAAACYQPFRETIVAPVDGVPSPLTPEALIAHEYGHHLASSEVNEPWSAIEWGTKRWATYLNICRRERQGTVFPGGERSRYALNPGEGFAEAYRVLNERRSGRPDSPWLVVDPSFMPDDTALQLLEQDVREPWTKSTETAFRTTLGPGKGRYRVFVATPLDGELELALRSPGNARYELRLYDATGRRLVAGDPGLGVLHVTVCGERGFLAVVSRSSGSGPLTLSVSRS